ncbi:arginine beta-hydroxylase, Fe(II)/alpha-ketoglutarate-dependent [Chitinophaga eiseniae]|uniref:Arginine beta-hydroxylase, Fe(II)/alpha-ketoglutarate-dependent n=1 Tax=Chitinophaga eiseniae TaxID=634771 RepID=A0A1T4U809_9BACT|nr:TauD/TfdA family dioxygenase [Chitinophaga eiseniae]SKA48766.1 arginine beta-hydroxylase, Fe(II)/alpha-ketoglutarate-dependent [Chitinophaga eiseniae]
MNLFQLDEQDNSRINSLLAHLTVQYESPCNPLFLQEARVLSSRLPEPLMSRLNAFRYHEDHNGLLMLRGFEVDDRQIGPTPNATGKEIDEQSAAREGFLLMLLASFLGDSLGWANQRNGALLNNVLPLKDHESEQLSTGSVADLSWHNEEAFHPFRADYLALMCLRNPDNIPTLVGSIQDVHIPVEIKEILFEPRFIFHTDKNFDQGETYVPVPEPVLFGDFKAPYVRLDPAFMSPAPGDEAADRALTYIIDAFDSALRKVPLTSGDILFMDNYRVVHGRKGFKPRFDGNDRWLKRVNITLDLRKSRAVRPGQRSHVIITD